MRVKLLVATISLLFINHLQSQTVFWSEDFGTGCSQGNSAGGTNTANGTWTITNVTAPASDANQWYISATEAGMGVGNCGDGCLNNSALTNRTLHVGSVASSPSAGVFCPTGDCGAIYDSGGGCGFGFGCVSVNDRAESPVINCTGQNTITLTFLYFEGTGDLANDFMEVMYSANGGGTWSSLAIPGPTNNTGCPVDALGDPQGRWTTYTVALPATANNNPNVKLGFRWQNNDDGTGNDPAPAVDDIQLSIPSAATPTVSIAPLPNDSICVSSTLTLQGTANPGPITSWAWTVNPTAGVVFNPDTANQNPTVTFTTPGTYTFTLFASNGSTGSATQVITVLAPSVPTVTVTASPANPVCIGSAVGFTATPTNGGSAPTFTWSVNGVAQAGNTNTFSSTTLANNDVITVTVTSNDSCVSPATAGDSYTVQVVAAVVPSVTIAASTSTACAGSPISFTATPTNGGATPTFQWQVNGANTGANSPNFSSSSLNNNDTVRVILTSSNPCASPTSDTSNLIVVAITPTVTPSVSVTASAASACAGAIMSFTASPTNGGTTPVYQWQVNGANAGSNSPNFSSTTLNNGDTVAVILTSNVACPAPATASDTIFVVITPTVVPAVSIAATPTNPVCATTVINFTATPTNGGATPVYQWQVNGVNVGVNSPNFTSSPWANNDVVTVTMTSNAVCAIPGTATASYTVAVVTPTVNAIGSPTVCPGIADTLIATATAGSTFSWTPSAGLNATNNDTAIATLPAPGSYTYYATATFNGCTVKDSVIITVNNFTVSVGPSKTICYGDSATIFVTGGTSWTWIPNLGLHCDTCQSTMASPSTNPTASTSTTYSAIVSNGVCTDTVTETVTVIPNASPAFSTTIIQQGLPQLVGFTNNSTNATSFFWNLGNGNTSVLQTPAPQHYLVEGSYTVTLIAYGVNGCNDTTTTVIMIVDTVGIVVPNIFTPNGDEINDVWKPSVHGATSLTCSVFDRWGVLMYEFVNIQDKWDGHTTAGLECTQGTYYYILKATDRNNKSYNLKGFIQLIR